MFPVPTNKPRIKLVDKGNFDGVGSAPMKSQGIPLPRQVRDKYGVGAMPKFGDPVTIPLPNPSKADYIRAAIRSKGRYQRKKFVTRLVTIEGKRALRVWRIE
jgi:hypothetical protein